MTTIGPVSHRKLWTSWSRRVKAIGSDSPAVDSPQGAENGFPAHKRALSGRLQARTRHSTTLKKWPGGDSCFGVPLRMKRSAALSEPLRFFPTEETMGVSGFEWFPRNGNPETRKSVFCEKETTSVHKCWQRTLHDFDELRLEELPVPRAQSYGDVVLRIKSQGSAQRTTKR